MQAVQHLTVLYDPTCGFCVRCRQWLEKQPKFIEMRFIPQGSSGQQRKFPDLNYATDKKGRPEELIVIDDAGKVYRDDKAWVMCFYALREYRSLSMRLARPGMAGLARRAYAMISHNRRALSALLGMKGDDDLRTQLRAEPETPRCNNALDTLRQARETAEVQQGGV
ncbi:MAG: DCC1-like thiol-disulfide oxidoreductase family protein [Planctomycetota bacterium]